MNARQRMSDVVKLRCNACQDLLKLVIRSGWQRSLYDIAQYAVINNTRDHDAYINVYNEMRDDDPNAYTIEQMDISLIYKILLDWYRRDRQNTFAPLQKETWKALGELKNDRNITQHSNENEEDEELYLRGILALYNLRRFVRTVDDAELTIDDEIRHAYRTSYIQKINSLVDTLDNERIQLVKTTREWDADIEKIKSSDNPEMTWFEIIKVNWDRCRIDKGNYYAMDARLAFAVRASDAGIKYAHIDASAYFAINKNPKEAVKRLQMYVDAYPDLEKYEYSQLLKEINFTIINNFGITDDLLCLVDSLRERGVVIEQREGKLFAPEIELWENELEIKRQERLKEIPNEWTIKIR